MNYIYLAGEVDPCWGEISLVSVKQAIEAARADDPAATVTIVLNSFGGDVMEGLAIYNYLRRAKVNIEISGMAASIASIIALAGQHIAIYDNSTLFVHHAWAFLGESNANDARSAAERMDAVDEQLTTVYASRGLTEEQIREIMDGPNGKGTLITSAQALELGLVDEILDPALAAAACMKYRQSHHITRAAAQPGTPTNEEKSMDPEETTTTTVETDAACGDPKDTTQAAEETTVETTETVTDDPDDTPAEEIEELKKELEEVKKELAEAKAKLDKSAKLSNSVHAAQTSKSDTQLSWPELVKKIGYVQARAKYPKVMDAYCRAELAKGSIR